MKNTKNYILYYFQTASYSFVNMIAVGTIFQTFMLECGISKPNVSFCVSTVQIIQTLTTILVSKFAENIKNVLRAVGVCLAAQSIPVLTMLFICLCSGISLDIKYILLFSTNVILGLFMGLYSILAYKQPYHIMKITEYGRVSGQSGVIAGVIGALATAVIAFALEKYSYFATMTVVLIFALIMAVGSGAVNLFYTPFDPYSKNKTAEKINIFRYKPFYQLLLPNLLRGVSTGIFNLIAVIGYDCKILDKATSAILVTLAQIATLVGCQTYSFIAARRKSGIICLISSVVMLLALPLMTAGGSVKAFIGLYFVAFFFVNYINHAVPVIVAENIDYNCLGQYTAWRMALHTAGVSIGGALVPILLDALGGTGTLLISGITMLPCGVGYYIFDRQNRKNRVW